MFCWELLRRCIRSAFKWCGFKPCLPERTTASRQNFQSTPRKNSPRRFSRVCATETWVCVIIGNVTAERARRYLTPLLPCVGCSTQWRPCPVITTFTWAHPKSWLQLCLTSCGPKCSCCPPVPHTNCEAGLQKQPGCRLGWFGFNAVRFLKNFHYFSVLPDIPKILFNPVGRTENEFDKELPVKGPSWIYCLFVVSPCSGRSSLCAGSNLPQLCCVSEAEECKYRFCFCSNFKVSSCWSILCPIRCNIICQINLCVCVCEACCVLWSSRDLWAFFQERHPRTANNGTSHFVVISVCFFLLCCHLWSSLNVWKKINIWSVGSRSCLWENPQQNTAWWLLF